MLVFVIPLKSPQAAKSWSQVSKLFERCVKSLCSQTSPDFRVLVVCNEKPYIKFSHPNILYLEVNLPIPQPTWEDRKRDKEQKLLMGLVHARKLEPSYIMPVDADDCLSKHLVEFVNRNSHCNGWFVSKGYEYQEGSRLIYLRQEDFYVRCGSCNIIRYNLLNLPENINYDKPRQFYQEHGRVRKFMDKQGTPIEPLPFPGVIYITEHGENNYYQKGFGAENPRMTHNPNKFMMVMKKAYKILNSRPLSPAIRDEFNLYPLR